MTESCVTIPAVPAVPRVPARTDSNPNLGWNAGARSIATHDGSAYLEFDMPSVAGVVIGIANTRRGTDPVFIPFGFLFAPGPIYRVIESGSPKTAPMPYTDSVTVFRIERRNGVVRYFVDRQLVHTSELESSGALLTVACLYAALDQVGGA